MHERVSSRIIGASRSLHSPPPVSGASAELVQRAADVIERVRDRRPRVHCITNAVAQTFTANLLLAAGAVPSMTLAAEEVASFAAGANALLVNLGTFDEQRRDATAAALPVIRAHNLPWVLDPVFVDRSERRLAYARSLLDARPSAVRLNAAEFTALTGRDPDLDWIENFAREAGSVVALTGEHDVVTDGARRISIANGDTLMTRVTAMGCAASALVAACLAVESDPWVATSAGLAAIGIAGERAALKAEGPGSFVPAMLDALYRLDRASILADTRLL